MRIQYTLVECKFEMLHFLIMCVDVNFFFSNGTFALKAFYTFHFFLCNSCLNFVYILWQQYDIQETFTLEARYGRNKSKSDIIIFKKIYFLFYFEIFCFSLKKRENFDNKMIL